MNEFNSKYFNTALRMDEALIALLEEKDLEYITVKEICEEADVNRSTFYLHYETVGDLVDETTEMINKRFLSYFPQNERDISDALNGLRLGDLILVTGEYLIPYLRFIRDNKKIYRAAFRNPNDMQAHARYGELKKRLLSPILDRFSVPAPYHRYYIAYYIEGIIAIVKEWLRQDCEDEVEVIADIIERCVRPEPEKYEANSVWLDLGTGTGAIPRGLADHGANIIGVDISSEQIEQAKNLSEEYKNITYIVCPVEKLKFANNFFDTITACQCFWYFNPKIVVDKIRQMIKPNGLFLKLYMSYLKDDPIAKESHSLVKQFNPNWVGGSPAVQDLKTHYFDNPIMDSFTIDLPFTRESWHGRIKACRGVLASMDTKTFEKFEEAHIKILQHLPEQFTIKHKVFLTYYIITK